MRVAVDADNSEVVESAEFLRHVAFTNKEPLARVAPCLLIIRVRGVLKEADRPITNLEVVPAHNGGNSFAVALTRNRRWIGSSRHRWYLYAGRSLPSSFATAYPLIHARSVELRGASWEGCGHA